MIHVVAKNYANADHLDVILKMYAELVELTRQEDGCLQYELYSDVKDATKLTMIETWASRSDLDNHLSSDHFTRIVPELKKLMSQPGDMSILEKKF